MAEKTKGEQLAEKLLDTRKNLTETMSAAEKKASDEFCEGYKKFLDNGKVEREGVAYAVGLLEKAGYTPFDRAKKYKPGDRVYYNNRGKALIACTFGKKPVSEGVRIGAAHIDSPRLDLKPQPLYEEAQLAFFKTHYYGGIKKYQWTAIPLALHGVIVRRDGTALQVRLGDEPGDPVFMVTDLLPHLAADQMKKTLADGVTGEQLNVLAGSEMYPDEKAAERVKLNVLRLLNEKYGITERDLETAELCAVPAFGAADVGLDRSMIGAYGNDDRVCAYPTLMAQMDCRTPEHTALAVLTDKEETGSDGVTGLNSFYLVDFIEDLADMEGAKLRHVLAASKCISADVTTAFDPNFADVSEKRNTAYLNYGVAVEKYTGARGKSSTNDAPAEMVAFVTSIFDKAGVIWQMGELGKVDQGGGGTVAKYVSQHNVDTIDVGVPMLCMHAPFELVAKSDVYMMYKAAKAFFC